MSVKVRPNTQFVYYIVPKITDVVPSTQLNISSLDFPSFVEYADPTFFRPGKIHALIGAEFFYRILKNNSFKVNDNLFLQDSVFGWIPTGSLQEMTPSNNFGRCHLIRDFDELNNNLTKFWELEAIGIKHDDTKRSENDQAQQIFDETVRFVNGRYEVQLPWKEQGTELRDNYNIAKQRLEGLQGKFFRNPELYHQYSGIIEDYLNQGIIEEVDTNKPVSNKAVYYLPHHAVCKEEKLTTKVRIVFDASSHDDNQPSLNDCLWPGPNLNPLLFDILVHFRLNEIAFCSDIEKAFLQISLKEKDRDAVRFLWFDKDFRSLENFKIFRFKRVLFGVNASPFLLSATIKNHIQQYKNEYPRTVHLLNQYVYVDDFISGEDTLQQAYEVSINAKKIMSKAGMNLRKWVSNDDALMKCWQNEGLNTQSEHATISLGSNLTKVLGMAWKTEEDCLTLEVKGLLEFLSSPKGSKRILLQAAGKIFDPLGMLTPFTIRIKCLFQKLWTRKIPWDEKLPPDVHELWLKWCEELPRLAEVKIPRKILSCTNQVIAVEIHAFSDASKSAYGAAVYLRVKRENGIEVNLVTSKSRVAPIKVLSIPRLELLGALLSARLTKGVKHILDQKIPSTIFYWTDSKITLYWIKGSVRRWKQFVANRVTEIQTLTDPNSWYHCPSQDNPADQLSRGVTVNSILENSMWFKGPSFLTSDDFSITNEPFEASKTDYLAEMKPKYRDYVKDSVTNVSLSLYRNPEAVENILGITNNYCNLLRILAYVYRFIHNCKCDSTNKIRGCLSTGEINKAENNLIRLVQNVEFKEDLKFLQKEAEVHPSSKIKSLSPFLDKNGLIRVGGRLRNSSINYDSKHSILLPPKGKLTGLIISYYHVKYLHSGPQNLLYQIRQKYWPLNGRNLCRKIVHNCIVCFKSAPKQCFPKMGDLPKQRVNRDFVFNSVGIDLCGPFFIKNKGQRKGSLTKIFVCIFICLVTKATHLEIVSDFTSESMIAALKRFIARRGKCSKIFSDNGTNFVGANRELQGLFKLVRNQNEKLTKFLSEENIEWEFIPPRAPNFGGLWEAGVKSFKYYFKRTVSHSNLTYEEFLTVLVQIESMLNSRPLTPLTSDIEDLEILTPAHFLIGRSLTAIPEPFLTDLSSNRLSLWQKTTKSVQTIWKKWSLSYLNTLQQRNKWMFKGENVKIGNMVLIKEDNMPVNKWILGRITKTYPGKDNVIRVADIKTKSGILKRAVSKLSVLPLET